MDVNNNTTRKNLTTPRTGSDLWWCCCCRRADSMTSPPNTPPHFLPPTTTAPNLPTASGIVPSATLVAPEVAGAGSTIAVNWTGPNHEFDCIAIARANQDGYLSGHYTYLYFSGSVGGSAGNSIKSVQLLLPADPGRYDIKYIVTRQDDAVLAQRPITLTAIVASITAPATAVVGSTIDIAWTGPSYFGDYIIMTLVDQQNPPQQVGASVSTAASLRNILLNAGGAKGDQQQQQQQGRVWLGYDPGRYDLLYVMGNHNDKIVAQQEILLTAT